MEPEFYDGDIIVLNPVLKQDDYIVVCNEGEEATFKQLRKYGKIRLLHPLNPK
ncbi:MAG: S24 family peptidase [Candidatus Scalindua sp.]|nr:S24 family peptidase [Candidatus Scalindua sp.]